MAWATDGEDWLWQQCFGKKIRRTRKSAKPEYIESQWWKGSPSNPLPVLLKCHGSSDDCFILQPPCFYLFLYTHKHTHIRACTHTYTINIVWNRFKWFNRGNVSCSVPSYYKLVSAITPPKALPEAKVLPVCSTGSNLPSNHIQLFERNYLLYPACSVPES